MTAPSNANTSGLAPTDALRLVPCPFDGGAAFQGSTLEEGHYVMCSNEAWNRRSAPASPLPGGGLPADVVRLVIAARMVAFDRVSEATIAELDAASEAFASRVPWDDEPDEIPAAPTGDAG